MKRRNCLVLAIGAGMPVAGFPAAPALQGFTQNLPPLSYADNHGPQGFSVELLRLLAREAKVSLSVPVTPWQRAGQLAAAEPASVLFSLARLPEREKQFQWVSPITQRRILVYRLASRDDLKVERLQDLSGGNIRLGVLRESATDLQLKRMGLRAGIELEEGLDDATNLRKLLAGRMEFVAMLDWSAAWTLKQMKLPKNTLHPVLELDTTRTNWYGLHPDFDPTVVKRLQTALDKLRRDGHYEAMRRRYFP